MPSLPVAIPHPARRCAARPALAHRRVFSPIVLGPFFYRETPREPRRPELGHVI